MDPEGADTHRLNQVTTVSKYLSLTLFVVLPFVGFYIGVQYGSSINGTQGNTQVSSEMNAGDDARPSQQSTETWIRSDEMNIAFDLTDFWREVTDTARVSLPIGMRQPVFLLQHTEEKNCYVAGGDIDRDAADYQQASFATRVTNEAFQIDGNWWHIDAAQATTTIEFTGDDRQFLPNEIRVSGDSVTGRFVLWHDGGEPVPTECDTDLNTLLRTTTHHYRDIDLSDTSSGMLSIQRERYREYDKEEPLHLIYTEADSNKTYSVMYLPEIYLGGTELFVTSDTLYGFMNMSTTTDGDTSLSSNIAIVEPFTESAMMLFDNDWDGVNISSLYLYEDTMYVLAGGREYDLCNVNGFDCEGELYSIDVNTGERTLLARDVNAKKIRGYDEGEDTLYLTGGWGDAGAMSLIASTYTNTGVTEIARASGCCGHEDDDYDDINSILNEIDGKTVDLETRNHIEVEGGVLRAPDENVDPSLYRREFIFIEG